jgi:molecular chaperone GrpE (heat shock protein)
MKKAPQAIAEMMLAKTVLEEKNEVLEAKDRQLRELTTRLRNLTEDFEELKAELEASSRECSEVRRSAYLEGASQVVEEVVGVLADWGPEEPKLAAHLLAMLREKHGLEVIEGVPEKLDPHLHRVLEVSRESQSGTKVLAKGFRLEGRVLRPALVGVGLAADMPPSG